MNNSTLTQIKKKDNPTRLSYSRNHETIVNIEEIVMEANHVIVWLDHREAHIIAFNRDTAIPPVIVRSPYQHEHLHRRADVVGSGKASERSEYYEQVVTTIRDVPAWLIVGPANAKLVFAKHVSRLHADLLDHIVGIETVDHPSDGQLLKYARQYFVKAERMAGIPTPM
jgi:hypothetical protein